MKPKDLKPLFTFETRKILLEDGIFYLPEHLYDYDSFSFPDWQDPLIFGNSSPIAIEFCAGNGSWIEERAKNRPHINWVAVEKRFDRIRKIWSKKKNANLKNLFAVCGEGRLFSTYFVPSRSISEIYINFPDPWPKKRHAKHRIMTLPFLNEMARILKIEGDITFVTDDLSYMEETEILFKDHPHFFLQKKCVNPEGYGNSYFDTLWRNQGRMIYYAQYYTK